VLRLLFVEYFGEVAVLLRNLSNLGWIRTCGVDHQEVNLIVTGETSRKADWRRNRLGAWFKPRRWRFLLFPRFRGLGRWCVRKGDFLCNPIDLRIALLEPRHPEDDGLLTEQGYNEVVFLRNPSDREL